MVINGTKYITEKEISSIYGLSVAWFRKTRYSNRALPHYKLNRHVYYNEEEIKQWFDENLIQNR